MGTLVKGADVGEEIGGVEQHLVQVEAELAGHVADKVAFDGSDRVERDAVHVIPEALAGELAGADGQQAAEDRGVEPAGESGLGSGGEAAVEDGDEQVEADGGAGAALGAWRSMSSTSCRRRARESKAVQAPNSRTTAARGWAGAAAAWSFSRMRSALPR